MQKATKAMQSVLPKSNSTSSKENVKSLSTIEDKELRKKLRNRQSALAARERKKARLLQLEQTVSELQLANQRLTQENAQYRQILNHSNSDQSNHSEHVNYGQSNCQHWQKNARSNQGDSRSNRARHGHKPTFPSTLSPKTESQSCALEGSQCSSSAHFAKYGSGMPMRKRSVNLPPHSNLTSESYQSASSIKVPEKRRKSCPSYSHSYNVPNELQWSNPRCSISGTTFTVGKTDFTSQSAIFSNSLQEQQRVAHPTLPQSPVKSPLNHVQEITTPHMPLSNNSSLPPINDVLGCGESINQSQFAMNDSRYSKSFNSEDSSINPNQWENTYNFNCKQYSRPTLVGGTHHFTDVATDCLNSEVSDSYQHPTPDFSIANHSTGQVFNSYEQPGYSGAKTYDEIFEWISEGQ